MEWLLFGFVALGTVIILFVKFTGPVVPEQRIDEADLELVRE